ncbi:hypothetical protein QFZ94_007083 [Paraburkholderia sp. JPY465]
MCEWLRIFYMAVLATSPKHAGRPPHSKPELCDAVNEVCSLFPQAPHRRGVLLDERCVALRSFVHLIDRLRTRNANRTRVNTDSSAPKAL